MVPKRISEDPEFRFGKTCGAYHPDAQRIGGIINYQYLKEHLTESITKKALEDLDMSKVVKKDWRNKVFHLRSQSVAKVIEKRKKSEMIETQKLNHTFRRTRDSASNKNMYKFPSGNKTAYSESYGPMSQTIQAPRTKLPPLSAMGDYE